MRNLWNAPPRTHGDARRMPSQSPQLPEEYEDRSLTDDAERERDVEPRELVVHEIVKSIEGEEPRVGRPPDEERVLRQGDDEVREKPPEHPEDCERRVFELPEEEPRREDRDTDHHVRRDEHDVPPRLTRRSLRTLRERPVPVREHIEWEMGEKSEHERCGSIRCDFAEECAGGCVECEEHTSIELMACSWGGDRTHDASLMKGVLYH